MNKQVIDILADVAIGVGGVIFGFGLGLKVKDCEDCSWKKCFKELKESALIDEVKRTGNGGFNDALADIQDRIDDVRDEIEETLPNFTTLPYWTPSTHEREIDNDEDDISKNYILPEKKSVVQITEHAFDENDWDFDVDLLTYYDEDDVLTDDRDEVLANKEYYLGTDIVPDFKGERSLYFVHYEEKKLFEIELEEGSYSEIVLGINPEVYEKINAPSKYEKEE